ncbi:piggyBac transposable element-derived protein 3-like [Diabrotica virgifera virgifera]|uniref:PiggyBac transposable element-derived protein domain-containing protein n=1 Tax=Diabrotica virgifera virgifera TaxID=50390 RepID=A0ABM5K5V1_DIAVI|nr:piggyBac transposable element-derived protein 3-like [Diabrotica virgifera virgifera]
MAVYFVDKTGKRVPLSHDLALELLNDGNESEIEDLHDENDDVFEIQTFENDSDDQEIKETVLDEKPVPSTSSSKARRHWKDTTFQQKNHDYPKSTPKPIRNAMEYFSDYLNDGFFDLAANCTNNYFMRKTGRMLNTNSEEIKKLIGIHLIMGCIPYPRLHMYWRQGMQLHMVSSQMPRDRFKALRTALHVVDEDIAPEGNTNVLWKVQPIITAVKRACDRLERRPGNYSIDEQIIPFCGRCANGLRQVVKNKPRPQGLKVFVATTSDGLMIDFEVYQGARTPFPDRSLGVSAAVILHLSKSIPPGSCVFFDRYFSSILLIEPQMKLHGTATLMMNRLPERRKIPFKEDRCMKRGESQQFVYGDLVVVKWKDNKSVLMVSNCTSADNKVNMNRWDKT